jgi:hypothetical protein
LEPWIKTVLESARANHVNKFFEEKLQLGAVRRSQTQRQYCPVRVGPKTGAMVSTVRPKKQLGEGNPGSVGQSSLVAQSGSVGKTSLVLRSLLLTFLIRVHSYYYLSKFSQLSQIFSFELSNLKSGIPMILPLMILPSSVFISVHPWLNSLVCGSAALCPFVVGSSGSVGKTSLVLRVSAVKYFCPHFCLNCFGPHTDFIPILDRFWVAEFVSGHFK